MKADRDFVSIHDMHVEKVELSQERGMFKVVMYTSNAKAGMLQVGHFGIFRFQVVTPSPVCEECGNELYVSSDGQTETYKCDICGFEMEKE